jgi:hypothetical protein
MHTHHNLGNINGEPGWQTGGVWEKQHQALSLCGKTGYFLSHQEALALCQSTFIHIDVAPYPQTNGNDPNPYNNGLDAFEANEKNKRLVHQFCSYHTHNKPRYLFITADRLKYQLGNDNNISYDSEQNKSNYADRLLELINIATDSKTPPVLRATTTWFKHGVADVRGITYR